MAHKINTSDSRDHPPVRSLAPAQDGEHGGYLDGARRTVAAALAALAIAGCSPDERPAARPERVTVETTIGPQDAPYELPSTTIETTTTILTRPTTIPDAAPPIPKAEIRGKKPLSALDRQRLIKGSGFEALAHEDLHVIDDFPTGKGRRVVVVGVGDAIPQVGLDEIRKDFQIAEEIADVGGTAVAKGLWLDPGFQTSVEIIIRSSDLTPSQNPDKPIDDTSYIVVADNNKPLASLTSPVDISSLAHTTRGGKSLPALGLTTRSPYLQGGGVTVSLVQNVPARDTIDNQPANARVMGTEIGHAVIGFDLAPRYEREVLDALRPDMSYVLEGKDFSAKKEELVRQVGDAGLNGLWYVVQELRAGRTPTRQEVEQIPMTAYQFQNMGATYIAPSPAQVQRIAQLVD